MERNEVYKLINGERDYQDAKWGTIDGNPHTVGEWLLVLQGELDEAMHAWRKSYGDTAALDEIRQVAAVAVAAMEEHGAPPRRAAPQARIDLLEAQAQPDGDGDGGMLAEYQAIKRQHEERIDANRRLRDAD